MNILLLCFLACLFVSGGETVPAADPRIKVIDGLLTQAEAAASQFVGLFNSATATLKEAQAEDLGDLSARAQKQLQRKCLADFSAAVIAGYKTAPIIYGTKSPFVGMVESIRLYYECQAFTQRKPELCQELARYQSWEPGGREDFQNYCGASYKNWIVTQLVVAGRADAAKICQTLPFSKEQVSDFSIQDECAWMTTKKPSAECQRPIAAAIGEEEVRACIAHDLIHADENTCPTITKDVPLINKESRTVYLAKCWDVVAYRKAFLAKNAGLCGSSLTCRMLMGEKVCERHWDKIKGEYCRSWTQERLQDAVAILSSEKETSRRQRVEIMETLKSRRVQIEALFNHLGEQLESFEPKSDPAFVSRRDAYRALRKKLDQSFKKGLPAAKVPER